MKIEKKEYLKPETTVCVCDTESLLDFGSSTGTTDVTGGGASGPDSGGPGSDLGSKENSGSLWDFDNEE